MTPEALKAAQKMIADSCDGGDVKVVPKWEGQLDGYDVFSIGYADAEGNELELYLGYPSYVLVDPKHPDQFLYKCDNYLSITERLNQAEEEAERKAKRQAKS